MTLNELFTKKAFLFDLDGTLIDTEPQYSEFWHSHCYQYLGDATIGDKIKGCTLDIIIKEYFSSTEEIKNSITRDIFEFEKTMTYPFIAGAREFIEKARERNILTAIVTSSNREKMQNVYRIYPEFASWFDAILTADDFTKSKPDPQCFILAAQKLNVSTSECVIFEDSHNGLLAARHSGATVVGLTTTLPTTEVASLSDIVLNNFL